MIEKQYTIMASTGFPRAATLLVRAACKVHAHITLLYQEKSVELKHPPKSLIEVMTLGITPYIPRFKSEQKGLTKSRLCKK
nr:HPr family phosphocarrier protein [Bacillus subtilis]